MMASAATRGRTLSIAIALIAVAAVGGLWWHHAGTPEQATSSARDASNGDSATGNTATESPAAASWAGGKRTEAPLPAPGVPFGSSYADLKRRADLGQPKAACLLAIELKRCDDARARLSGIEANLRSVATPSAATAASPPAAEQARIEDARRSYTQDLGSQSESALDEIRQCDPAPASTPAERARYWRVAALAGHLPSLTQYAVGNAFRWNSLLSDLPGLTLYRREGESLARRAAAAGDIGATLALAYAYGTASKQGTSQNFLTQVVAADDVESLALYRQARSALAGDSRPAAAALRTSIDSAISGLAEDLTLAQRAQADDRARQHNSQWQPLDITALPPGQLIVNGSIGDVDRTACDSNHFAGG